MEKLLIFHAHEHPQCLISLYDFRHVPQYNLVAVA